MPATKIKLFSRGGQKVSVSEDAMMVVRYKMHEYDAKELADTTGLSLSCIHAVKSGRTKWPRPKTLFSLLEALGLELYIQEADQ